MSAVKNRTIEETKHDKFIRLAERRTTRALEELRLVSQLASPNYEYSEPEVEAVIEALCNGIHKIADSFELPFVSAVGDAVAAQAISPVFNPGSGTKTGKPVDEFDIIRSLDLLKKGETQDAYEYLQAALRKQKR